LPVSGPSNEPRVDPASGRRSLREEGPRAAGKISRGGTSVGVHRAKELTERRPLSLRDVVAISAYFARHEIEKASMSHEWGDESDPSAGYVAWLLWGGDPGRRWADSLTARLNKTAAE
jgi:hypothetical protein